MVYNLENLCGVPSVISISNFYEVKKQIFTLSSSFPKFSSKIYKEWKLNLQGVVTKILGNFNPVMKFIIPRHLFPLIGIEMLKWATFIETEFGLERKFIVDFIRGSIFTSRGKIDEVKAARELINEPTLSSFLRYKIACYYFLEDIFPHLWLEIRDSESDIEEALKNHNSDDPVGICSQYLQDKEKSATSVTELNYMKCFVAKVLSYGIKNDNSEAMKFYFKSKKNLFSDYETKNNKSLFLNFLKQASEVFDENNSFPQFLLLSRKFDVYRNILLFLLETGQQNWMQYVLGQADVPYTFLKALLLWPFQDLFIKVVNLVSLSQLHKVTFYRLMHNIVDLICDEYFSETYDYRTVLKEFWSESQTDFKNYVFDVESEDEEFNFSLVKHLSKYDPDYNVNFLLPKLLLLNKFTSKDEDNFRLILENASLERRERIVTNHKICVELLVKFGKFNSADAFIKILILSEEERKEFKKSYVYCFKWSVLTKKPKERADQFIKWVANSGEEENLKQEIFRSQFHLGAIVSLAVFCTVPLTFFSEILKWLVQSDDKISKLKMKGEISESFSRQFFVSRINEGKLKKFWKWLEYSSRQIRLKKKEILRKNFYDIIEKLLRKSLNKWDRKAILYLCSFKNERVNEFIIDLRRWCKQKIEKNECIFCRIEFSEREAYIHHVESASRFSNINHRWLINDLYKKKLRIHCSLLSKILSGYIDRRERKRRGVKRKRN